MKRARRAGREPHRQADCGPGEVGEGNDGGVAVWHEEGMAAHALVRHLRQEADERPRGRDQPAGAGILRSFHPAEREAVRAALGLPLDARILVFGAYRARSNPYKDSATIEAAVRHLAEWLPRQRILFVGLGEEAPEQVVGNTRLRFLPFQPQETLARYLQAADVYVHAARAENAGLIAAEAQACGTPVVATAVGGLGETMAHGERGLLVPAADPEAMAEALRRLPADPPLGRRLGAEAARYARKHWGSAQIEKTYLRWFESALNDLPPDSKPARPPDLLTRMARHVTDSYRPSLLRGR
jgi:glycosyltransferase involved in cell wall biosynthesis